MDRRPLHLLLAFALVASLMGVSTALVAEVREEILGAQSRSELDLSPPEDQSSGLPINEFTLLDPAPAQLGAIDRQGRVLHVQDLTTLFLAEGDRIQVAPIELTGPTRLELPRGAIYKGSQVTCPQGCMLYAEQGRLAAPPNATVVLPQGTQLPADRGELAPGSSYEIASGARLFLAPLTLGASTTLPLTQGSTIILPQGTHGLPGDPSNARHQLPAGTIVRGALQEGPEVQRLLDRSQQAAAPPLAPPDAAPTQPTIEVTEVPEAIRKGVPFTVKGTVHEPDGSPSVDHPVTIYANATKQAPGFEIQIGKVTTDEDGRFEALARINTTRPTQPYHIVAQAHALPQHDPPFLEAWSDPVVGVEGDVRLELDLPATEGRNVPVTLRAKLLDEYGAPVPSHQVRFTVHGLDRGPLKASTDDKGQALVILEDGFPFAATWNVSARFEGTNYLPPAKDWQHIRIVEAHILTDPTIVVPRGSTATLNGEVRLGGGEEGGVPVQATYAGQQAQATTGEDGTFQLHFDVPADLEVGNHTMELATEGVSAHRTVLLTVTGQSELHARAPSPLPLGGTLPLQVRATDELGTPLAGVQITAKNPAGAQHSALSDEQGRVLLPVSLSSPGTWNVTLTTPGTALHSAGKTEVPLRVGPLNVAGEPRLAPGEARNATYALTIGGQPLDDETVRLDVAGARTTGTTNPRGLLRVPVELAPGTQPGQTEVTLQLPRYNVLHTTSARILVQPQLDVNVLSTGQEGDQVRLKITALGHSGFLDGLPLTVQAQGAFKATEQAVTGPDGSVEVELDRPRGANGLTVITIQAEETGTTAPALQVASTQVTPATTPWWLLALLLPLAAGAYAAWRYLQREPEGPATPRGPRLALSIPPQDDGLPPVWHTGAPTTLRIQLTTEHGHPIAGVPVRLSGPHGKATVTLDEQGSATLAIPATQRDEMSFHGVFEGDGPHPPVETSLDVRLVDYREEIDREYQDLRETAAKNGWCAREVTPRELAQALGGSPTAKELAQLFERCDYSLQPVDRSDYVSFMKAKEAVSGDGANRA